MDAAFVEHIREGLLSLILLIVSIGLHEFGHAWVADLRGDPLPRAQGRVSLNPFVHADPIGTIAIPAVMIFLSPGVGLIGWGRPVQVALLNPRTRRADDILITLAGPGMNLLLCIAFALIGGLGGFEKGPTTEFLAQGLLMNASLIAFNLIPVPPLDGSRVALRLGLFSEAAFMALARWGFIILLVLVNLQPFRVLLGQVVKFIAMPCFGLWEALL
ncbi:MAG: site-2 protease family protein [Opitutia bacterium]